MKSAICTGITGMDGSHLCDQLMDKGYKVYGLVRRSSNPSLGNSAHLANNSQLEVVEGDITDLSSLANLCKLANADLFFSMAAQSVHPESLVHIKTQSETKTIPIKELWEDKERQENLGIAIEICKADSQDIEVEVMNMPLNTELQVLAYKGGMGQWFPIKQISRHKYKGTLCQLRQKWGEVLVTPNHSIYDINGKLVSPVANPEMLPMRKIDDFNPSPKQEVDLNIRSKTICSRLSLVEGNLQEFLKLCGAYISEGQATYSKLNNSHAVTICSQNKDWLKNLQSKMSSYFKGSSRISTSKESVDKDIYQLEITDKDLYLLMRKLCGTNNQNKKIPNFLFGLEESSWKYLLDSMVDKSDRMQYKSASSHLIAQLGLIWSYLGIDYVYNHATSEKDLDSYKLQQCKSYQTSQDSKDYENVPYEGYVYDISVDEVHNFIIGLGNVVVHNSHVGISFKEPSHTLDVTGGGVLNCLEAIRISGVHTKFLQASTSELFGGLTGKAANEKTPFHPRSPYGVAKLYAYWITVNYREAYKMFACNSICFNHESERRGENFVTRKITKAAARIKLGLQDKLYLGNLDAKRDWGYAPDYTSAMIDILTKTTNPDDYVLATGKTHSVRDFCNSAFGYLGLDYQDYVEIDPQFYRPAEVDVLIGDARKVYEAVGWKSSTPFATLVEKMVDHDFREEQVKNLAIAGTHRNF